MRGASSKGTPLRASQARLQKLEHIPGAQSAAIVKVRIGEVGRVLLPGLGLHYVVSVGVNLCTECARGHVRHGRQQAPVCGAPPQGSLAAPYICAPKAE